MAALAATDEVIEAVDGFYFSNDRIDRLVSVAVQDSKIRGGIQAYQAIALMRVVRSDYESRIAELHSRIRLLENQLDGGQEP